MIRTMSRKNWLVGTMSAVLAVGVLSPSFGLFDKTRFATDVGVAFYSFHHFVYNPYKAGKFQQGAPGRTKALVKGGAALLFAVNRIKAADNLAHKSKSPLLQRLAGSLDSLQNEYTAMGQKLKGGQFNAADVEALNSHVGNAGSGAAAAGIKVKDRAPEKTIPGTED